jgi:hypothetical protein
VTATITRYKEQPMAIGFGAKVTIKRPDGVQPDIEVLDVTYSTPQEAIEVCVGNAARGQTTRSK